MNNLSKIALAITLALGLTACGGSSSTDKTITPPPPPANTAPTINLTDSSVAEKQTITLTADVTDNGTVSSYAWQQDSGTIVELAGSDTNSITFTAPSVTANEELSFTLTATDNEGLASTSTIVVTVEQTLITLTLSGVVTDSPVAAADITVKVGETEQIFTADNNGAYSAELIIDDDQANDFVSVIAQGKEQQKIAKFTSLLGTVNALTQSAGDDNTLTSDEKFSVNITNLTTAKAALILRNNEINSSTSDDELANLMTTINPEGMFTLATALKVAVDKSVNNDTLKLPDNISDTLALVLDAQASQNYIDKVTDSIEYTEARIEMMADNNIVDTNLSQLANEYFFIDRRLYEAIKLQESDHTGTLYVDIGAFPFTWTLTDDILSLDFSETPTVLYIGYEQVEINGQPQGVQFEYTLTSTSLQKISDESGVITFEETMNIRKHYLDVDLDDAFEQSTSIQQAVSDKAIANFALSNDGNAKYSLPIPYNFFKIADVDDSSLASGTFNLKADGSGHLEEMDKDFTWQLVPNLNNIEKRQLVITFSDNTILTYTQLTNANDIQHYAAVIENSEKTLTTSGYIGGVINEEDKFLTANVPGIYVNDSGNNSLNQYWWELWPTGQAYTVSTYDQNKDGQISADEVYIAYGDWSVTADNQLNITRRRDPSRGMPNGCFFADDSSCFLYNDRYWQLFGQDSSQLYITNYHNFDFNGDGVLNARYIDNRSIKISTERPVALPELDALPKIAPQKIVNLLDPSQYIDKTLYAIDHDNITSENGTIASLSPILLKADGSVAYGDNTDSYTIFADNSIVFKDYGNYAFMLESNDVVLGSFIGLAWPHFKDEATALSYADNVKAKIPASSYETWFDQNIYFAKTDDNGDWIILFVKVTAEKQLEFYKDESFSELLAKKPFTLNSDGSITTDGNSLFISLTTDKFSISINSDVENSTFNESYLFTDFTSAKDFTNALTQLRMAVKH